jgi:hypothetical protein
MHRITNSLHRLSRAIRRIFNHTNVYLVPEDGIEDALRSLGYRDSLVEGNINCSICGTKLDMSNLGSWVVDQHGVTFFCDQPACSRTEK